MTNRRPFGRRFVRSGGGERAKRPAATFNGGFHVLTALSFMNILSWGVPEMF